MYFRMVDRYSADDYVQMTRLYCENGHNGALAARLFADNYPGSPIPNGRTILRAVTRLRETGTMRPNPGGRGLERERPVRDYNVDDVMDLFLADPELSLADVVLRLGLSKTSVYRIMHDARMHPFHYRACMKLSMNNIKNS